MLQENVELLQNQLEALKLLRDWSTWLVTVQAVSLGLVSALWGKDAIKLRNLCAVLVFIFFGLSIICATFVLAGLPDITQRMPINTHQGHSAYNIYKVPLFSWLPDWQWVTSLWTFTFLEHLTFLLGIVSFIWGVLSGKRAADAPPPAN
jgi:hypothetical protein